MATIAMVNTKWTKCSLCLPPSGVHVQTKVQETEFDDPSFEQTLYRDGHVWLLPGGDVKANCQPTHWRLVS